jgi:UDP-glucose 4-epimerase
MARSSFLVTGGAGFIGSHLCEALVADGHTVRVLDDLSTGSRANLPSGVELIEGDVADPAATEAAIAGVDGCFHLAAIASVARGVEDWLGTHHANLTGTITVFEMARRQARRIPIVYASSAAVYGDCADLPITEAAARRPLSAYGADKYGCELHALVAARVHALPTVGLRFFNVYGPHQDPRSPYSGVISIFCERLRRGAPIDIHGDGGQTRDFIAVADVVAALLAAMDRCPSDASATPAASPLAEAPVLREAPVFNVCSGTATSVLDLAQTIAVLLGRQAEIRHLPARAGDIRHSVGSPANARAALGLAPPMALHDGLRLVLDWLGAVG